MGGGCGDFGAVAATDYGEGEVLEDVGVSACVVVMAG